MTDTEPKSRRSRIKFVLYALILIIAAAALAWVFGPREAVDLSVDFNSAVLGDDLDSYLAQKEAAYDDLRPATAKEIVWAYPASKAKTPIALVYLHGFSAAKGEIRPVPDDAARELGANLYFARLAGHGRSGEALSEATVHDWIQDAAEAIAIGERIGEKVVIISTSTGGSLAALAASLPELKDRIAGIVFISPNFGIKAANAQFLTFPFARTFVPWIVGKERSFDVINEMHGENWTTRYPSVSLLPMAAMVKCARALPFPEMKIPALFIYHPEDQVLDHAITADIVSRWGGPSQSIVITSSDDPSNHVIAGDILSPSNNGRVTVAIVDFAKGL
jgi:esterase/lipase